MLSPGIFIHSVIKTHCGAKLKTYFGHYQTDPWKCNRCGAIENVPSEIKTDVNLAVEVMTDAFADAFDNCLIIMVDIGRAKSANETFFGDGL